MLCFNLGARDDTQRYLSDDKPMTGDSHCPVEVRPSREDTPFTVSADGQVNYTLTGRNVVQIKKAEVCTTIIKTKSQSFYDVLRHKLSK